MGEGPLRRAQRLARLVRAYPSTLLWPIAVLGITLGLCVWGVTEAARRSADQAKDAAYATGTSAGLLLQDIAAAGCSAGGALNLSSSVNATTGSQAGGLLQRMGFRYTMSLLLPLQAGGVAEAASALSVSVIPAAGAGVGSVLDLGHSSPGPREAVTVEVASGRDGELVLMRVSPHGGWRPPWFGGLMAVAVVLPVALAVALFAALVSRRLHQLLLEELVPGDDDAAVEVDTPAEVLLRMVGCLLHNQLPQLRDILLIRTAVLQRQNIYESMYNATGFIKGANLDADVARALMHQLCTSWSTRSVTFGEGVHRRSGGGGGSVHNPGGGGAGGQGTQAHPQHDMSTLQGALAVLLTPNLGTLQAPVPAERADRGAMRGISNDFLTDAVDETGASFSSRAPSRVPSMTAPLPPRTLSHGLAFSRQRSGEFRAGAVSPLLNRSFHHHNQQHHNGNTSLSAHGNRPSYGSRENMHVTGTPPGSAAPGAVQLGIESSMHDSLDLQDPLGEHDSITAANAGLLLPMASSAVLPGACSSGAGNSTGPVSPRLGAGPMWVPRGTSGALPTGGESEGHQQHYRRDTPSKAGSLLSTLGHKVRRLSLLHQDTTQGSPLGPGAGAGGRPPTARASGPGDGANGGGAGERAHGHESSPRKQRRASYLALTGGLGGGGGAGGGGGGGGGTGGARISSAGNPAPPGHAGGGAWSTGFPPPRFSATGGPGLGALGPPMAPVLALPRHSTSEGAANGGALTQRGGTGNGAGASRKHRPMSPPQAMLDEVEKILAGADRWQFDTWRLAEATQGHPLSALGFFLIQRAGLVTRFKMKPMALARALRRIEAGYPDNPYHNATHATDVLQTLHALIHGGQLHVHYVDPLGLFAAYWAAIVHDYGHPGLTNDFLIATSDPLAVRYNDRSPLENHHSAASFGLLRRPELNILTGLSSSERGSFRKQVIEMVLATDMKQHFSILSHFNTVHRLAAYAHNAPSAAAAMPQSPSLERAGSGRRDTPARLGSLPRGERDRETTASITAAVSAKDAAGSPGSQYGSTELAVVTVVSPEAKDAAPRPLDDTERLLSLQVAIKVADLGHLGEALEVHRRWLGALEEEFFRQGDRERELGLPISPLFDRAKQGVSKSQVGFYDFVALPLVHALTSVFPGTFPLMRCFVANCNHWRGVDGQPPIQMPSPGASSRQLPATLQLAAAATTGGGAGETSSGMACSAAAVTPRTPASPPREAT